MYSAHRVAPTPQQATAVREAVSVARTLGLQLPAMQLYFWRLPASETWCWPDASPITVGKCLRTLRPTQIWLCADRAPDAVFATCLHELQHAADCDLDLTNDELEQRAEAFTERALTHVARIRAEMVRLETRAWLPGHR
jgi:hypothetical protein